MEVHHVTHSDAAQERDLLGLTLPTEEEVQRCQDEEAHQADADADGEAEVDELQPEKSAVFFESCLRLEANAPTQAFGFKQNVQRRSGLNVQLSNIMTSAREP